jgi:ADP-dependent phosphofructokinase/glucokinase
MSNDNKAQKCFDLNSDELQKLMNKLEKEGENKVKELMKTEINDPNKMIDSLLNIMKEGEKEFIQKTRKNMSYSEMRQLYG